MEEKAEDQDSMEQAEHDLLADLRRARRSLRLQAIRGWDPYPFILLNLALSFQAAYAAPVIMMSQNRQQDIDRKAAEKDYRINVKAELEIELLHEKIDQLREREVLKLTEAVRGLTELRQRSASHPRESDSEGGRPS